MRKDIKEIIKIDLRPTKEKILHFIFNENVVEVITLCNENLLRKHFYNVDKENNVYYSGSDCAHFR